MLNKKTEKRIASQGALILDLLKRAGARGMLNLEMQHITLNHTARIAELRKTGCKIDAFEVGEGVFRYFLKYEPIEPMKQERAVDIFVKELDKLEMNDSLTLDNIMAFLDGNNFNVVRNWGCNK